VSKLFYPGCRAILQVVFDTFGDDDDEPVVIPVLVKSATVHANSYRQADSYEITFDAGDLPFDPRLIRAGAAEVYLFQTDGLEDSARVSSRKDPLADLDAGATGARGPTDALALELGAFASKDRFTYQQKPRIAGLFDRTDIELSEDGKWVSINGQDYTAHLASIQWKPNPDGSARRIPIGKRIDELLDDLLAEADPTGRLRIDVRGLEEADLPVVGEGEVRGNARGIPVDQKTTYWDVMYKIAIRYGFILFVDALDVVLTRPKTITDKDTTTIKRLVWGKNLEHLRLERELGKEQVPTIVVKSYDPITRKTITVEYPDGQIDHSRQKKVSQTKIRGTEIRAHTTEKHRARAATRRRGKQTTTLRKRDEYEIVTVYGISDRKALERIAESRYHLIGKSERRCVATTRDLKDMRESDMLNLSAGDAVMIEWDEFNRELLSNPNVPDEAKVEHLVDRGYNRAVARLVAKRYAQLEGLDRPLRVKEATYEFDVDDGISIELELYDFIMVDGIRSDSGATPQPRADAHRDKLVDHEGNRIGGTPEQRDALKRRYRP
jgi:hypothetical protein